MGNLDFETAPDDYDTPDKRVAAWNAWRNRSQEQVDLRGANLSKAWLQSIDFGLAILDDACLSNANLQGANLRGARMCYTNFRGALLDAANLEGAQLSAANLEQAQLQLAYLKGADLKSANCEGADFRATTFDHARLLETNLKGANLRNASFEGTTLHCANLERADLVRASEFRLDQCHVRDLSSDPNAKEPWLQLRRVYTGSRMLFVLFLFAAFLAPYVAKTLFWGSVNRVQVDVELALANTRVDLEGRHGIDLEVLADDAEAMAALPFRERFAVQGYFEGKAYVDEVRSSWRSRPVWQLLLGVDKGVTYWATAIVVILYNVIRIGLTYQVSRLRLHEEDTGISPRYKEDFIPWLFRLHQLAQVLVIVALASGTYHMYHWLTLPVWLP
jgi:hypothetical protein